MELNEYIYDIQYTGEPLYNVLLETHDTMIVNNLVVETLNPKHIVCKKFNFLIKSRYAI